ncbi:IS6 family transposase [Altererythrobacter sp. MF3-039]|uniref:IS6 family transposase n=1 Tax=Altererythrobacter sp. MF3-039 TaxID=3252901 RepID=UPI00390C8B06
MKISRETHYLWRVADHEGEVLESYVTKKRDKSAAMGFFKKTLRRHGRVEAIVTDGLQSYPAAMRDLGNLERREVGSWLNNRAENSHLPFRRRERAMLRFRQMKSLQEFASVHANVHNHFNSDRHPTDRQTYKENRSAALAVGNSTGLRPGVVRLSSFKGRVVSVRLKAPSNGICWNRSGNRCQSSFRFGKPE